MTTVIFCATMKTERMGYVLKIRHEDLIGSYEEKRKLVSEFDLMDDIFFAVVMEDPKACEYLLSKLLKKQIKVQKNKTQYSLKNIESHSVVLDALIEDEEHRLYDVEIQISDTMDIPLRMRYYQAMLDSSYLNKGEDYKSLPETYIIFITAFDPLGRNKNYYEVKQYIDNTEIYDNRTHQLFFNTAVDDGTELSELLQYLKYSEPGNNNFGALSKAVNFYKVDEKGVEYMCDAVKEYANEQRLKGRIEGNVKTVKNMLKEGISLETALKCAELDKETYEKYAENI